MVNQQITTEKGSDNQQALIPRILVTLQILLVSRLGGFIPIPGIDYDAFYLNINNMAMTKSLSMFSNGACSSISIFSLGIIPSINASIIIQLLVGFFPFLEKLQKEEGEFGRQKITQYTRYLTLGLALIESVFITFYLRPFVFDWGFAFILKTSVAILTGSMILMWLSELLTERGIGNGTSWFIFVNILSNGLKNFEQTEDLALVFKQNNSLQALVLFFFSIVFCIIFVQEARRKIYIISSKQLDRQQTFNKNAFIPFRLNQSGIMPLIFASTVSSLVFSFQPLSQLLLTTFSSQRNYNLFFLACYVVLIFFFGFFYNSILLDPKELATNLKKMSSSIPSVRPGIMTAKFLEKILKRLTFLGTIFLVLVALIPNLLETLVQANTLGGVRTTSLIILVGVAIENIKQIQTLMISRKYDK
jgi:preprotein translocase subunit SecY